MIEANINTIPFHKTRIAPTPSGYLHIGNALSFLLTASLAKTTNAKLLLRIDDLDKERTQRKYVEDIFDTLHFLGIDWQEGPENYREYEQEYSQRYRMNLYENALQELKDSDLVFACTCSRKEMQNGAICHCVNKQIPLDSHDVSWRLKTDEPILLTVLGMTGDCITTTLPHSMKSFVVRKKDGLPAYQLSSLIDDEFFNVDAIVRGEDLWDSTLAQQYLALILNKPFFRKTVFYHHPLVKGENGSIKLSKSEGATSIRYLCSEGKTREEVIAMIKREMEMWQQ